MNFKHLILLSLFVYATFAAQCNTIVGSCNRCQAAGCDWCDSTGFGTFSCTDAGTCPSGNPVKANGTCEVVCADYTKCGECQANSTCSYCSFSGFGSCSTGNCSAPFTKIETCPKICEAASPTQAGGLCNIPYQVPSNESFGLFWTGCRAALGYPTGENATAANCSDKCTSEYAKLPESCVSKQRLLTCGALCPACDADLTFAGYTDYFPCQSFCQDVNDSCNSLLSDDCKINVDSLCSKNAAKCNKITGVTTTAQPNECSPASSAAVSSAGQTSAGQTSAGQTSAGQTSAGQTSAGQTSAGQTSAGQTSTKASTSASTTGSAGSIFVCVILGFVALLI